MIDKKSKAPRMSNEAVKAKTGKSWDQWFAILDRAEGTKMTHKEIVAFLVEHGLGPWWRQMVTVTYEQAKGMREKHETPEGYQISVSKTMELPIDILYKAWEDKKIRSRWLKEKKITISKATKNKTIRGSWENGKSRLDIAFYEKGKTKTQIVVQENKLQGAREAEKMKVFWRNTLENLQGLLSED
jgi:hypothetical protein